MERLTERERNVDGTGVAKEEITDGLLKPFADKILTKLAVYEDLEEQGLLVKLPDDLFKKVYRITYEYTECSKFGETVIDTYINIISNAFKSLFDFSFSRDLLYFAGLISDI